MNDSEQVETFERDPLMESLLTTKILSTNDLNYQVIDVGMGNYFLYENIQPISVSAKMEYEVWKMFFDGARCKHGCRASSIFKSPEGNMKRFYFKFKWNCTNNATEYEAICLGLSKDINMGIKYLVVHGDSKMIINQVKDKISARHHYLKNYRNRV